MTHPTVRHRSATALAAALMAAAAAAQTTPGPTELQRMEITGAAERDAPGVAGSALRGMAPIERIPQSVVVLPRKLLDDQDVSTLSEATRNVSNVRGLDTRDLANGGFLIRGFDAAVLLDGVALPGYFSTPSMLGEARRIEVLKGPAGTLYGGSQAVGSGGFVGGLISLTTAAPEPRAAHAAKLRLGSERERGAFIDLNQPLGASFGARLVVDALREGSETTGLTQTRTTVSPSFAWRPSEDSALVLRLRRAEVKGRDYAGLPLYGSLFPAAYSVPRSTFLSADGQPDTTTETSSVNLQWRQRLSTNWSWQLTLARVRAEVDQRGAFVFPFGYQPADPGPLQVLAGARLWDRFDATSVAATLQGQVDAGPVRHHLAAGLDLDRTRDDAFLRLSPGFGALGLVDVSAPVAPAWAEPDTTGTPDQVNRYRSSAVFIQDRIELGAWGLLAGLRHTRIRVDDVNPLFGYDNHSSNRATTARVGATYAFSQQVSAFAGYGEGIRVPTFAIYLSPPKPEQSNQKEVGLRLSGSSGVTATLALFDLTLKNVTVAAPNPTNDPLLVGTSVQAARQRSRGVDLDLRWDAGPGWTWLLAASRQKPENVDGLQLFNVPKASVRLATRHEFGAGSALAGLGVGLGLTWRSRLPGDAANRYATPAATLWDAQASYRLGKATLGLNVQNLADKQVLEPSIYFGGGQVTPVPRRRVTATARIDF